MARIVITRPLPEEGPAALAGHDVYVHDPTPPPARLSEQELARLAGGAEAVITVLSDPLGAAFFEACPRLRVAAQFAVGYDNIDVEAARRQGVVVTNTPGVLTEATADMAFALLLACCRRITAADRYVREGRFHRWETMLLLGAELHGKTLGIVGMGRIGGAVARRARGFGMRVLYHNRTPSPEADALGATRRPLEALLSESDIVSLHCPLNAQSRRLIDAAALARMKPGAYLINTARGPIVDEAALVEALRAGRLAGAGLDVFEDEPRVHPGLLGLEQVTLAPHLGSATHETRRAMAEMCARAVRAVLDGAAEIPYRVA